jgi:hypothetical protein
LCQHLAPELTAACEYWDTNDRDGLDAEAARGLAVRLQELAADGTVALYIAARNAWLARLPDEPCMCCKEPGLSIDGLALLKNVPCRACNGTGKQPPWVRNYPLEARDVHEWIAFLKACGGFIIC